MYDYAIGSCPAIKLGREFYLFPHLFLLILGLLVGLLAAKPAAAQADGGLQPAQTNQELATTVPLKSMKATADNTPKTNLPPTIKQATQIKNSAAAIPANLSVFQYLAILNSDGWSINLSFNGPFPNNQNIVNMVDSDLLREYQCQAEARQILQRGGRRIIIDAYSFATIDGAYGSYCAAHRGSSNNIPESDAASEDPDSISFCKDNYFFCIYGTQTDDDEAKTAISNLATKLLGKIKQTENLNQPPKSNLDPYAQNLAYGGRKRPAIFNLMPTLERVNGSEKLVMGPISIKRFFPAPYPTVLVPLAKGSVADYKLEWPDRDRLKLLIAHYPTAQAASQAYANYTSTLRGEHSEKSVDGYTFPTAMFKLANGFILCQLRDKQVVVINGAHHKDSLNQLAHQIYL